MLLKVLSVDMNNIKEVVVSYGLGSDFATYCHKGSSDEFYKL